MIRKTAFILIGDDRTGKTTFQKYLILHLCGINRFTKLNTNQLNLITHRDAPAKLKTLFTINRSIQEKIGTYKSIENYFSNYFKDADVVVLSSHSHHPCVRDIEIMLRELKKRYYNVSAVFFSNHLNTNTEAIAQLAWNDVICLNNPQNPNNWNKQIGDQANYFADFVIKASLIY